ncbi:MAG: NAD(P)H-hydrate dehydratase [Oscillospiraceae bacterium]|nr:NAD(P)H-hydrate dehydratase [Oscillospiraceae bacterium]MDY5641490.1 NAD(P)H-hydrate dehydratase [Candidatus Faecousia sp.]
MVELTRDQALALLPDRSPDAHKGDFGRILLLCGSRGYTGSAYLAAMGALRAGAGLVFLGVPESIYAIEAVKLNEAIVFPLPDADGALSPDAAAQIEEKLARMDAVLIGPGLGQSSGALAALETVLREAKCPVVVDADGINLLGKHKALLRGRQYPTILTPHEMEFARLGGDTSSDRAEAAINLARTLGCVLVRKGRGTLITDGTVSYRNLTGNPGMAVGGSGDVLAGIITAFLGQGLGPMEAAACGCWFHGAAGDLCARELGQYGMLPTDMLAVLPRLLK